MIFDHKLQSTTVELSARLHLFHRLIDRERRTMGEQGHRMLAPMSGCTSSQAPSARRLPRSPTISLISELCGAANRIVRAALRPSRTSRYYDFKGLGNDVTKLGATSISGE